LVTADPAKRLMHEMISDAIEVAMQEVAGAASAAQNVREAEGRGRLIFKKSEAFQ
jgi:hypothetical protein